jgi:hypothetical protein
LGALSPESELTCMKTPLFAETCVPLVAGRATGAATRRIGRSGRVRPASGSLRM